MPAARDRPTPIVHHELCFGCGQANLFGIQLEAEAAGENHVVARFFIKQDHQGPPGIAHGGIVATALDEAMALAVHGAGAHAVTRRFEMELLAPAPIGAFVRLEARIVRGEGRRIDAHAEARTVGDDARTVATARAEFTEITDAEAARWRRDRVRSGAGEAERDGE